MLVGASLVATTELTEKTIGATTCGMGAQRRGGGE